MDPRPIELHPAAIEEGRAAREWYEERSASASNAFMAELDVAIERIAADPERYASYLHGTRRYLLKRFPFFVVYRVAPETLQVIAVAHGKRKPGYWRDRLID
ncbi:MAG: type II toxin-antitoxin system RelE/ParE family toxin [Planctomycetota bacterium]|nr:type II toxin-antitoxin system RelE/ParE family toxin [Planctomycetota bacterium]